MRRYTQLGMQGDGDVATPEEIRENVSVLLEEVNGGLDRDNVQPEALTAVSFADDTFTTIEISQLDEGSSTEDYIVDPREGEGDWSETEQSILITTGDGGMRVYFNLTYDLDYPTASWVGTHPPDIVIAFGVRVDGRLVASELGEAFMSGNRTTDVTYSGSAHVEANVPVAAGEHRVKGVFRVYAVFSGRNYHPDEQSTLTLKNRSLVARYAGR